MGQTRGVLKVHMLLVLYKSTVAVVPDFVSMPKHASAHLEAQEVHRMDWLPLTCLAST